MSTKFERASLARLRYLGTLEHLGKSIATFTSSTDQSFIIVYKDELEKSWLEYGKAYAECEASAKEETVLEELATEYAKFHAEYITSKVALNSRTKVNTSMNQTLNTSMIDANQPKSVKLPAIEINKFYGDRSGWTEFKATCKAVITDDLPEIQKLQLLKKALEGEPRDLIMHILPSEGAYTKAMELLKKRYENTRIIVNSQLKTFFDLPICQNESKVQLRLMLNTSNSMIAAFEALAIDTTNWYPMIIYYLSQKFDVTTLRYWEESLQGQKTIPELKTFFQFIETRIAILESSCQQSTSKPFIQRFNKNTIASKQTSKLNTSQVFFTLNPNYKCFICQQSHIAAKCPKLLSVSYSEKIQLLNEKGLCNICLHPHETGKCTIVMTCRICKENHRTILHPEEVSLVVNINHNDEESVEKSQLLELLDEDEKLEHQLYEIFNHSYTSNTVILATALITIKSKGKPFIFKALIDQGSTANLITTRAAQMLQFTMHDTDVALFGVGNTKTGHINKFLYCTVGSIHDQSVMLPIEALVVKNITELKPLVLLKNSEWNHLKGLKLADPKYDQSSRIDMLLGASVYAQIIQNGVIKGLINEPIAQHTKLGWIISGQITEMKNKTAICNIVQSEIPLNEQLERFWQLEEVPSKQILTQEEQMAESIFSKSLKRCSNGRFMVDLPFVMDPHDIDCFGDSTRTAMKRYHSIQKRFNYNESLREKYDECINEYLELDQMELVDKSVDRFLVLAHHPVIKESSTTTKVRPVFDGSAKTSNGFSLNDRLIVGPTIQPELFTLLIQWRKFQYALAGDIEKMYRMILVNPDHANFQCIYWKKPGTDEIKLYKLLTVTFGTSSAPFQAIRALHEIGNDIKETAPELSNLIQTHFYVDDFMACFETVEHAKSIRQQITKKLAEYGFTLRKWKSNSAEVLEEIAESDKEKAFEIETTFKTLGISWQPSTDLFIFKSGTNINIKTWTKRAILSEISKLFDPLGWLTPCIVKSKLLMQDIWRMTIGWDDQIPIEIEQQWLKLYEQLCSPIPIQITRWIGLTNNNQIIEIHGFSDASMSAYGAVIYIRINQNNSMICHLLTAKTKVAPIGRNQITLARLELCAALLLARLMSKTTQALNLPSFTQFAWTDSMIVLSWISSHPSKWNVFVSNRVSEIQRTIPVNCWNHISSKENPADLASRGAYIHELAQAEHWWHGPEFLLTNNQFPSAKTLISDEQLPEKRKHVKIHTTTEKENYILNYFSSLEKLLRFSAYVQRWMNKIKKSTHNPMKQNPIPPLDAEEIFNAKIRWIKLVQFEIFENEIKCCKNKSNLPKVSLLKLLNPFIDENGILRMNGRVNNIEIRHQKTAIILPGKHLFTELLIKSIHLNNVHSGVQLTLRALRDEFWIVHARVVVKKIIHKCVICFRYRKNMLKQQMSELPMFRTEQARPFAFVGCDYAGFFCVKNSERRNAGTTKAYIALFICLSTKALHLETVCSLSSNEFVLAFENFIARRGIPNTFFSDNGTNFIGGEKEIKELHELWFSQTNEITRLFAEKQIKFRHIPPRASHMAGIWERAVGSVKFHLKRVLQDTKLTFRQFDHVLKQIEACLNSRPLWAFTSETDDIEIVTPSHFFNFQAINTLPKPDVYHIPLNRLDRMQYLYRLYCAFWHDWSKEYLHQLQVRNKWQFKTENVKIGQIVLISEDNLPPCKWMLGKITKTYPGKDGLIRVVDVEWKKKILKRPIHRLSLLPIEDNYKN